MVVKHLRDCPEFTAGDDSRLRELFHAGKGDFAFRYSLARAVVAKGAKTAPHTLKTSEVYYMLEGEGRMHVGAETAAVGPGDAVYIPPNALQYIENTGAGELAFLCIVDPAWRREDESVSRGSQT